MLRKTVPKRGRIRRTVRDVLLLLYGSEEPVDITGHTNEAIDDPTAWEPTGANISCMYADAKPTDEARLRRSLR